MFKKLLYGTLIIAAGFLLAYFFQPIKKSRGADRSTRYVQVEVWPTLPAGFTLGNPTGLCLDTSQNLVVFHRADRTWPLLTSMPATPIASNTILIINKDSGQLIDSWGTHLFIMPHGLTVDNENNIWVTDVGLHQVFKFSHEGKLLLKLGEAGIAGRDPLHFNKPTAVAIAKDGSFYVSDGYGNSRIIKFSAQGKYLFEWGRKGNKEGEFNIPHAICLDTLGHVYVADRENNRIQVFDENGKYLKQFTNKTFGAICAIACNKTGTKLFAVDDFSFLKIKHRGSDVLILDSTGQVQTRFGRSGSYAGSTTWYHTLAVDNDENIYVGDILQNKIQLFRKIPTKISFPNPNLDTLLKVEDLKVSELIARKIVDTSYTAELGEGVYRDKTVRLNDSIYYTVFSVSDKRGVCSFVFVATLSTKRKNAIATRLLHPDCNVDLSWEEYDTYEHAFVSQNKIEIITTTTFQKRDSITHEVIEETDHEAIQKRYVTISPTGKISTK
jgi:peptidylamidoglycolate lyase